MNYLCNGLKAFFHHIDFPMQILAELIRHGLPASEVMRVLVMEEAFVNARRNDPCPCGSGKKYKKCCLAKDEAEALRRKLERDRDKQSSAGDQCRERVVRRTLLGLV